MLLIYVMIIKGKQNQEVTAVRLEGDYEAVKLGTMEATFTERTNCCVYKGVMYVTGAGQKEDEIWSFSLDDRVARQCGRSV